MFHSLFIFFSLLVLSTRLCCAAPVSNLKLRQQGDQQSITTSRTSYTSNGDPVTEQCVISFNPVVGENGENLVEITTICTSTSGDGGGNSSANTSSSVSSSIVTESTTAISSATDTQTTSSEAAATTSADPSVVTTLSVDPSPTTVAQPVLSVGGVSSIPVSALKSPEGAISSISPSVTSSGSSVAAITTGSASTITASASSPAATSSISASGALSVGGVSSIPSSELLSPGDGSSSSPVGSTDAASSGTAVASIASDTVASPTVEAAVQASASAVEAIGGVPATSVDVLPIGLGVFAGISVIALAIVGLVTYERTKYRKKFRAQKLAEQGQAPGYGGTA